MNEENIQSSDFIQINDSITTICSDNTFKLVSANNYNQVHCYDIIGENEALKKEIKDLRHIVAMMNTRINHLMLQINQLNK